MNFVKIKNVTYKSANYLFTNYILFAMLHKQKNQDLNVRKNILYDINTSVWPPNFPDFTKKSAEKVCKRFRGLFEDTVEASAN